MAGEGRPYVLKVSLVGGRPQRYTFDQERVLVGRGLESDLRIEHAGVARAQLLIERGTGSQGEPRFRITPYEATNPTFLNERPAVEGTLTPGDLIAVADVRIVLENKGPGKSAERKPKQQLSLGRAVLLTLTVVMALVVAWLFFGQEEEEDAGELAAQPVQMFALRPQVRCGNPIECDTRAHDAYQRGKKLLEQAAADPGNLYRAALELDKAAQFREQSGRALPDLGDVGAQLGEARSRAEAELADAKFRLSRAIAAGDLKRQAKEAALLARILPDERHPYRIKLDAYRRTLPRPPRAGGTK